MSSRAAPSLALLTAALACNGPAAETSFASSQPGPTMPADSSTGTGGTTSSSGGETSTTSSEVSSAGTTEPLRDLGTSPDFGPGPPEGCKGKIDFLFLTSRFGQMQKYQEQLLASFPEFMDTIETMFPEFDTQIMFANPDGTWPGWICEKYLCEGDPPHCGENGKNYLCGPNSYEQVTECDELLGAGLTYNAGPYGTGTPCHLVGDHRYMITRDEPDPLAAFECIARVGTEGPPPPTGDALIAAVSPNYPLSKCNKGFLRKDALLFITLIVDTDDEESKTYVSDWYKAIVAAKYGDANAVVALAVLPQYTPDPVPGCTWAGDNKNKLREFIDMFKYHAEGDLCTPSYAPYFAEAAELIAHACDNFVIPQ